MNVMLLLAGGTGSRMNSEIPKQYIEVGKRRIIDYSLDAFAKCPKMDLVCIVAHEAWRQVIVDGMCEGLKNRFVGFANPGETRQMSILNGLHFICEKVEEITDEDRVVIHDAARPNITSEMLVEYLEACVGHDGVMPVLPMKDTVYACDENGRVTSLLDRKTIWAGQAPEVFALKKYIAVNEMLLPEKIYCINGSTEPAILAGLDIVTVAGEERNIKITTKGDLERFRSGKL